ncbi:MAG: hypothetical protein Q8R02_17575 [Hyphomonadaceae bacterium]|nr:hypothetical protein [Hyphomonadaceae bacterium]
MTDTLELSTQVGSLDEEGMDTAPPPFEGVKWRVKIGDTEYGPYPRSRLIDFLKEGRVTAGTFIRCGNDADYHRADHHPNLRWDFKAPRKRKFGDPKLEPGETEVPVCNYFIAARLLSGNERFERVLRDAGKMTRAAGDMWVLRSKQTVHQLRNQLTLIMKPHEHFIIVNASKDRLAWFNVGVEADIAVRGVWDSDEVV